MNEWMNERVRIHREIYSSVTLLYIFISLFLSPIIFFISYYSILYKNTFLCMMSFKVSLEFLYLHNQFIFTSDNAISFLIGEGERKTRFLLCVLLVIYNEFFRRTFYTFLFSKGFCNDKIFSFLEWHDIPFKSLPCII